MKALALFPLGALGLLSAAPPVVIYQPAPAFTVVSPLTSPTAQSGQTLLNQINGTLAQRQFEHQALTVSLLPQSPVFPAAQRIVIQPR